MGIDRSASSDWAYYHREEQANVLWAKHRVALRDKRLPLSERIMPFHRGVCMALSFGSPGWTWVKKLIRRVRTWERSRLRSILRLKWDPAKCSRCHYMQKSVTAINGVLHRFDILPLHVQMISGVLAWAYQIFHLRWKGNDLLLHKMLVCRSSAWWEQAAPLINSSNDRSDSFESLYRHRKSGTPGPEWDHILVLVMGWDWPNRIRSMSGPPTQLAKQAFANQVLSND